uniref:Uncharacterized protein n=1 Tax=viral metagenome TaxID=1070528 RepID=A0A6M3KTR4_9ZZZZ
MAEEIIGLIHGQVPGSTEEWRVAVALERYKIDYSYQVPLFGGRLPGGQILDFVVYIPFPTPLQVFGKYWHSTQTSGAESLAVAALMRYYEREPIIIWDYEIPDQEEANKVVKERVKG